MPVGVLDQVLAVIQAYYPAPVWLWINQHLRWLYQPAADMTLFRSYYMMAPHLHLFHKHAAALNGALQGIVDGDVVWHLWFPRPEFIHHQGWLPLSIMCQCLSHTTELRTLLIFVHQSQLTHMCELKQLAPALKHKPLLRSLVICIHRKCIHGVDDYRPMVHCIRDLPRLRHLELNLAGNVLGHQCGYILGSLCLSTSIEVLMLNLSECDLRDVARGPMCTASCFPSLTSMICATSCKVPVCESSDFGCATTISQMPVFRTSYTTWTVPRGCSTCTSISRGISSDCTVFWWLRSTATDTRPSLWRTSRSLGSAPLGGTEPRQQVLPVLLPNNAVSSLQQVYEEVSFTSLQVLNRRWQWVGGRPHQHNPRLTLDAVRDERRRCVRSSYTDIIVDREAWEGQRPDWAVE